jgi:hypothetical protein
MVIVDGGSWMKEEKKMKFRRQKAEGGMGIGR